MAKTFWDGLRNYFRSGWSQSPIDYSSRRTQRKLSKGKLQGDVSGLGDIFDRYGMLGADANGYRSSKTIGNGGAFSNTQLAEMQFNHDEAQVDRDWNERMYNMYQSPEAQMRQYREAGLNPALMYQGGVDINGPSGGSAASTSGAVGGEDPQSGFERVMGVMSQFLNMITGASSIGSSIKDISNRTKATNSQVALQDADIKKKEAETKGIEIDTARKQLQFTIEQAVKADVITKVQADASLAEWNAEVTTGVPVEEATNNIITKYKIDTQNLENLGAEHDKITAETALVNGRNTREAAKNRADINKIQYEIGLLYSQKLLVNSQKTLAQSEKALNDLQLQINQQVEKSQSAKAFLDDYAKENNLPFGDYTVIALYRYFQTQYADTKDDKYLKKINELYRWMHQNRGKDLDITTKDLVKIVSLSS